MIVKTLKNVSLFGPTEMSAASIGNNLEQRY